MVKYYLAQLIIHSPKRKLEKLVRFELRNEEDPVLVSRILGSKWCNEKPELIDNCYYFKDSKLNVKTLLVKEITESTYTNLDGMVTKLYDINAEVLH